uniref:Interleukin 22 receptor subunit alpha 1 n=1 Tax=Cavia porcellus TaxID=10141 RepID=H0W7F6_CAVPO
MKTLLTILAVGSLAAHIAEDSSGLLQHPKFQSSNFENILSWDSGLESIPGTVYSVDYKKYGETQWLAKEGCQEITRKSCNLTMETGDLNEFYYARVTAISAEGLPSTKVTERFNPLRHTTIKPPDVTCIPKMRSIQMIVHPSLTPVHTGDGHQLTLEEIFHDLFYSLELQINDTYQMVNVSPGSRAPIRLCSPPWVRPPHAASPPPDRTWTYTFSGAILFFSGFFLSVLCYLSYKYITKPPVPPNSLNVQRVLTFQPLRLIQEHVLIPALDLRSPGSLTQPVQYTQVIASAPREPPGAAPLHSLPEMAYLGHSDISILGVAGVPPPQTLSLPPSYTPKAAPEVRPPSYTPQVAPNTKALPYTLQAVSKAQPPSYAPQATGDSGPVSYGVCLEGCSTDSPLEIPSSPKLLRQKGQLQKEAPVESVSLGDVSLQEMTSVTLEKPQEAKLFLSPLGSVQTENWTCYPTPLYLPGSLSLLSSVRIEGHPLSLALHLPSPSCSPSDQGPRPWGLLDSLVCPKDEVPASEAGGLSSGPGALDLEQPSELDCLFQDLALTVQWES